MMRYAAVPDAVGGLPGSRPLAFSAMATAARYAAR